MKEYKVLYFTPPFGIGPRSPDLLLVEATTPADAEVIVRDHCTRFRRIDGEYIRIVRVDEYQRPQVSGRVIP